MKLCNLELSAMLLFQIILIVLCIIIDTEAQWGCVNEGSGWCEGGISPGNQGYY